MILFNELSVSEGTHSCIAVEGNKPVLDYAQFRLELSIGRVVMGVDDKQRYASRSDRNIDGGGRHIGMRTERGDEELE